MRVPSSERARAAWPGVSLPLPDTIELAASVACDCTMPSPNQAQAQTASATSEIRAIGIARSCLIPA